MTLLKLDFFFIFSFAAQLIPSQDLGYDQTVTETVLVFVLGAIGLSLALVAVYKENKYALGASIISGVLAIGYLFYRTYLIAKPRTTGDPYIHTRQFLIFTTVIAAVLLIATVLVSCKCFWNVHNGLVIFKDTAMHKTKVYDNDQVAIDNESDDFEMAHNTHHLNASKTLLDADGKEHSPETRSKTQQQNDNMWSIE